MLYPIKLQGCKKSLIWGEEIWIVSDIQGSESTIINGEYCGKTLNWLISNFKENLLGEKVYNKHKERFPHLIKIIKANDSLSIQVHPDDTMAQKYGGDVGKTEMWYVLKADPDATLLSGFNTSISKEEYIKYISNNNITDVLNICPVKKGDSVFIPAGRVHAIGKGVEILEVQQNSNVTYRIYDYNRKDPNGNTRELHTQMALEATDFNVTRKPLNETANHQISECEYFTVNKLEINRELKYNFTHYDSFVVLYCLNGSAQFIHNGYTTQIKENEYLLLPAQLNEITIQGNASFIETYA